MNGHCIPTIVPYSRLHFQKTKERVKKGVDAKSGTKHRHRLYHCMRIKKKTDSKSVVDTILSLISAAVSSRPLKTSITVLLA